MILEERSQDALEIMVDEARFSWHETLGVPLGAGTDEIHRAVGRLAHRYAPDQGGSEPQRTRIYAAYAQVRTTREDRSPAEDTPLPAPDQAQQAAARAAAPRIR